MPHSLPSLPLTSRHDGCKLASLKLKKAWELCARVLDGLFHGLADCEPFQILRHTIFARLCGGKLVSTCILQLFCELTSSELDLLPACMPS